ncbi:MAG TPA: FUSC family protein, partial [Ferruginibacter sp.]|nr:FUSC family protein [Ferruginibacter sp.]
EYARFVSHQEIDLVIFRNNLHLASGVFRHALRMMITCMAGFLVTKLISYGHHSYWVLLTTIVILKPGFSLTRQRNMERLVGTIAGGIIGVLLLSFIQDRTILFALIIFFMIGTYTFQRMNYILMVIFITPYILILFNLLGLGLINVAQERLLDTAIASALAFAANYLLFPHWESIQLNNYLVKVLQANLQYLDKLNIFFNGKAVSSLEYKLARKEMYISTANLSAAFQRMLTEPKSKQLNGKHIYEFMVLNNVLSANIASMSGHITSTVAGTNYPASVTVPVIRTIKNLQESLRIIDLNAPVNWKDCEKQAGTMTLSNTDPHLLEQLEFIVKVSADIRKITKSIAG